MFVIKLISIAWLCILGYKSDHRNFGEVRQARVSPVQTTLESLPPSPANFNVPQTTKVIYHKTPVSSIFQAEKKEIPFSRHVKRESGYAAAEKTDEQRQTRRQRNSKLVRRFKSFHGIQSA